MTDVSHAAYHPTIVEEDDYEIFKGGGHFLDSDKLSAWLNGAPSKETTVKVTKKEPNWGKGESLADRTDMDCVYEIPGKIKTVFTYWEFIKGSYQNIPEGITKSWEYSVQEGFVSHISTQFGVALEISVEPYGVGFATTFSATVGTEEETSHAVTRTVGEEIAGPMEVRKYQEVQLQVLKVDPITDMAHGTPAVHTGVNYKEQIEGLITQCFPTNHYLDETCPWVGYILIPVYTGRQITKTGDNRIHHVTYDQARELVFGEGLKNGHWHISHWN